MPSKEGIEKYKTYMNKTEKAQKAGLEKYAKELRHKEMRESEWKAKREKEIKERGVKRDGREEFVPKQYAAEKKCKIAAERNQKKVSAREGERKKKFHAERV